MVLHTTNANTSPNALHQPESAELRRNVRDSLFCHLFARKENTLALYKELHPEDASASIDDIEIVTIQNVISQGMYNDLGFIVGGRLLVLVEAQTEWSDNIIVRLLLYLLETYRRLIQNDPTQRIHRKSKVNLPVAEFVVIYTGTRETPEWISLARDFFGCDDSYVNARARVISAPGPSISGQYVSASKLASKISSMDANPREKALLFVDSCIKQGILVEYMEECRTEVTDMLFSLFDQEEETRRWKLEIEREATEKGMDRGRAEGMESAIASSIAALMKNLGLTEQEARAALNLPVA